ncbi:bifunctional diguanylate cyclase/phosphohydrolase [Sulfurospirillum sp. 1612]|uniref:bifunctional diguanylate cyclase/phosphohydrolase n=1 Tax=Sulfurospirillum sp. 1612 TaxID=3094835 RepID=UPI002F93939F
MAILWTLANILFFTFQIKNENKNIINTRILQTQTATKEAAHLLDWSFNQKIKYPNAQSNLSYSLSYLLEKINKNKNIDLSVNSFFYKDELEAMTQRRAKTIKKMQQTKQEHHSVISGKHNSTYVYTITPLLATKSCLLCHIHDDAKEGDVIGSVEAKMLVPSFKDLNQKRYYNLILIYIMTWIVGLIVIYWINHNSKKYLNAKMKDYEENIYLLTDMMERRDTYTAGHSRRVAHYATEIAKVMNLSKENVALLFRASMLHDLGKIEIPDAILLKPDRLSTAEYELIKTHALFSAELLSHGPFKELSTIVLHHHERFDGQGYPHGLKGKHIPLLSQIIAVADAFDAITTNRAYKSARSKRDALKILEQEKGKQFNPDIVDAALPVLETIKIDTLTRQLPENKLDEMRFCYYLKDQLTGCYNINHLKVLLTKFTEYQSLNAYHLTLKNLTAYNKRYGWKKGDRLLKDLAALLMQHYPTSTIIRFFGDHFLIVNIDQNTILDTTLFDTFLNGYDVEITSNYIDFLKDNINNTDKLENMIFNQS